MAQDPSLVFLVGAGPGDPGLLTLRAVECLAQADLVVYDRLVPSRLLDHAPEGATRVCVRQIHGCRPEEYGEVARLLIEAARAGKRVVRLKGGDPFLFGRGGEEVEALRQAGVPYEVVPGVTAALAAAACAGIPLTHRNHASAVALVTGHEQPGKDPNLLDWEALARFPGTLVLYMTMSRLADNVEALLQHGKSPSTPAAVVRWASTGRQQTVVALLGELPEAVRAAGMKAPAVALIGEVVGLRQQLAWFECRPLLGRRVLVTRPRHQAAGVVRQLEQLGAVCSVLPVVEVRDPPDWSQVDRALAQLATYHWLVFTSVNGVHCFIRRLRQTGRDLRALGGLQLAVIGPGTADALRSYHLEPDLMPAEYRSEALAVALKGRAAGQRLLLVRADRGRDLLREELAAVATVDQVAVYAQVDALDAQGEGFEALNAGEIDYVLLTSSNIARGLARLLGEAARERIHAGSLRLVSISPVTSAALRELGLPVAAEALEYTMIGIVAALLKVASSDAERAP